MHNGIGKQQSWMDVHSYKNVVFALLGWQEPYIIDLPYFTSKASFNWAFNRGKRLNQEQVRQLKQASCKACNDTCSLFLAAHPLAAVAHHSPEAACIWVALVIVSSIVIQTTTALWTVPEALHFVGTSTYHIQIVFCKLMQYISCHSSLPHRGFTMLINSCVLYVSNMPSVSVTPCKQLGCCCMHAHVPLYNWMLNGPYTVCPTA